MLRIIWDLCVLIVLNAVVSCSTDSERNVYPEDFVLTETVGMEGVKMPILNGFVSAIVCTDNYLIVGLYKGDCNFAVFPLPLDGTYFYCGHEGRGPGELMDVDMKSLRHDGGDNLIFYDTNGRKKMSLKDNDAVIVSYGGCFPLELPKNGLLECFGGYVNLNLGEEKEYVWTDPKTNRHVYFSDYPDWNHQPSDQISALIYYKSMMSSPDGLHLAAFYRNFKKARFYESLTDRPKTVNVLVSDKEYCGIPVSVFNGVAALCSDGSSSEIQIWSWDGTPLERYMLPVPLSFVAVDKDGGIFGYSIINENFYAGTLPTNELK